MSKYILGERQFTSAESAILRSVGRYLEIIWTLIFPHQLALLTE